jgi:RNA polymerase sigma factor (sigma-70 family)
MSETTFSSSDTDDYLLEIIALAGDKDYKSLSEVAFNLLWKRHFEIVNAVAMQFTKGDQDSADDLVQETFIRVWAKANQFDIRKSSKPDDPTYSVRCWIQSIIRNIFFDAVQESAIEEYDSEESDHIIATISKMRSFFEFEDSEIQSEDDDANQSEPEEILQSEAVSLNYKAVEEYLNSIKNPDEAFILRINYLYFEKGRQRPPEILDFLMLTTNKTKEALRQVISRHKRSIKEKLEPIIQLRR